MKTRVNIILLAAILLFISGMGCKQELLNKPNVINTNAPGPVTNIKAVNSNGKAVLTYSLPSDNDLSYVRAVYETSPGVKKEVIASHYTNTMTLEGFGDTLAHIVKIYAVNSSEIASTPAEVTVDPLTPAFLLAYRSLKVTVTFGGFNVACNNPTNENLSIVTMVDTLGNGTYVKTTALDNIYSNAAVITGAIRGQPALERKFAFVVRDRWLNHSDTTFVTLKPLFEQKLPKNWSNFVLPGDATMLNPGQTDVRNIYNGTLNENWPNVMFTVETASTPQMVTLDLGQAHVLSRMSVNPHIEVGNNYYVRGNLKNFEIWGSNNPNISGALDATWTKLGTFTVIKPSGSAYGTETGADQTLAKAGWPFDFSAGFGAYRYIRIRNLQNWQGSYFMSIDEFTLWGQ
ncbi:protein of unknown function [Mucilaginibacter gossypiicola]|uniref:F5/8 type C domain-containing protein n=1 Tax=Mucilaginibacter gossypiicola TaxID=551995 RepID=A0A1H8LRC9_9SPHI|nr:DUF5000 domain-containing lipoprotein [Mucilaginibacter gossypiicola]SEO07671.1 protein of unknown function [Mucilaginibacter gossypiicola]